MLSRACILVCLAALLQVTWSWSWSSLSFEVDPKSQECFYEELEANERFEMDYEVVRGGLLDIEVIITNPMGNAQLRKLSFFSDKDDAQIEEEGYVEFTATMTGVHSICFNNRMSRWTPKAISFAVRNTLDTKEKEVAKLEHLGPVVDSVIKITETMDSIESIQHHLRTREWWHREVQETTNSRVQWLAILEAVALISISVVQLLYIQAWFADERKRRRV